MKFEIVETPITTTTYVTTPETQRPTRAPIRELSHVHYIAAPDAEPPCGDRTEA